MSDLDEAYQLDYFESAGFHRQACAECGDMFWSRADRDTCGEPPCAEYGFIDNPGFDDEYALGEMREAFRERRDMLADLFADHGVDVPVGDGAFYMMLPVDDDDQAWCEGAIEDAHVATVPGSAFGTPGYARLSYAASKERLREGVERLAENGYL